MSHIPLPDLDPHAYIVVDLETGTILNATALFLVPAPTDDYVSEAIHEDDNEAVRYAIENGVHIYAREDDLDD